MSVISMECVRPDFVLKAEAMRRAGISRYELEALVKNRAVGVRHVKGSHPRVNLVEVIRAVELASTPAVAQENGLTQ